MITFRNVEELDVMDWRATPFCICIQGKDFSSTSNESVLFCDIPLTYSLRTTSNTTL